MILDFQQALAASANNPELAERLLKTFIKQIPDYQQSIKLYLTQTDIKSLRELIHKLNGAVEYLGVPELKQHLNSMSYNSNREKQWLQECLNLIDQLERIKQLASYHH